MTGVSGVYKIVCTPTGRVYVGSSHDVRARLHCHRSLLKTRAHFNRRLQSAYNKYGADAFSYSIVEACDIADAIGRERHWIYALGAWSRTGGFNLIDPMQPAPSSKRWIAVDPEGAEHRFADLSAFCRGHGLSRAGAKHAARGAIRRYCGWHFRRAELSYGDWNAKATPNGKLARRWEITRPDGTIEIIENLNAYCKKNGLNQGNAMHAALGSNRSKSCKGYRIRRLPKDPECAASGSAGAQGEASSPP